MVVDRHKRTVILIEIAVLFFLCYDERVKEAEEVSDVLDDDWNWQKNRIFLCNPIFGALLRKVAEKYWNNNCCFLFGKG